MTLAEAENWRFPTAHELRGANGVKSCVDCGKVPSICRCGTKDKLLWHLPLGSYSYLMERHEAFQIPAWRCPFCKNVYPFDFPTCLECQPILFKIAGMDASINNDNFRALVEWVKK